MQASLNNFYNKNKKKISGENKKIQNKHKVLVEENKINKEITKEIAEDTLKEFDLNPKYGPCKGIPRMRRYLNAVRLNLDPPNNVKSLIEKFGLNTSYYDTYI